MRFLSVLVATILGFSPAAGQIDSHISDPSNLNTNGPTDTGNDVAPRLATDGQGTWLAVWSSYDHLNITVGDDPDILFARSTDGGVTWTDPAPVNNSAYTDVGGDIRPDIATDRQGKWIVVWESGEVFGNTGIDHDLFYAISTDLGETWTDPSRLNLNAPQDGSGDYYPDIATDGNGNWVAVWYSRDTLRGTIGGDEDILYTRSTNDGVTWSWPAPLNTDAETDVLEDRNSRLATSGNGIWITVWDFHDLYVSRSTDNGATWTDRQAIGSTAINNWTRIATDGAGTWILIWHSTNTLGGTVGDDDDIVISRSIDDGLTWSAPAAINATATIDGDSDDQHPHIVSGGDGTWLASWYTEYDIDGTTGGDWDTVIARSDDNGETWTYPESLNKDASVDTDNDFSPFVAHAGAGKWLAAWQKGTVLVTDYDLQVAQIIFHCEAFKSLGGYGRLVLPQHCTGDASGLSENEYGSAAIGLYARSADEFYLSSEGTGFAPLVIDDSVSIDEQDVGLGPYSSQPGMPPYILGIPVEYNLEPLPAPDVTGLIPVGASQPVFEVLDADRQIYGHTPIYLVRDCGIYLVKSPETTIHFVSHDVEIGGLQSDLDVVTGLVSELRIDQGFASAACLGSFVDTSQVTDQRPAPPAGDGFYYLVAGTCSDPSFGDSSLSPDPRDSIVACP